MKTIVVINPNSSQKTTDMMVGIVQSYVEGKYRVEGRTATRAPMMIVDEPALTAAADEVVTMGVEESARDEVAGMIVSAYGDPGLEELRQKTDKPVTGLCEASMLAAAAQCRRFAVATTTPDLVQPMRAKACGLGLEGKFTGIRLTEGDPLALAAEPQKMKEALAGAVLACVKEDGAEGVIIGGGPLGQAALELSEELGLPVVAPLREAALALVGMIEQPR